jgi:hypothetical protein
MSGTATQRATLTIRVDAATRDKLEHEAAQDRRSLSNLAELLLADALRDREQQAAGAR